MSRLQTGHTITCTWGMRERSMPRPRLHHQRVRGNQSHTGPRAERPRGRLVPRLAMVRCLGNTEVRSTLDDVGGWLVIGDWRLEGARG